MANLRRCLVRFTDLNGIEHHTEVTAHSLYETVALAMKVFREEEWSGPAVWETGYFEVQIKVPEVSHRVILNHFNDWLQRSNGAPRDVALRQRLKAILGE